MRFSGLSSEREETYIVQGTNQKETSLVWLEGGSAVCVQNDVGVRGGQLVPKETIVVASLRFLSQCLPLSWFCQPKLVSPPKKSTSQNGVRSIFSDDGVAPVAVWGADPAQVMSSQSSPFNFIWIFNVICIFSSVRWCLCNYLYSFRIFCVQYGVLSAFGDVITMSSKYSINYVYFLFRTSVDVIAVIFILSVFAVLSERSMISSIICIFCFICRMRSCQYWNIEAMSIML